MFPWVSVGGGPGTYEVTLSQNVHLDPRGPCQNAGLALQAGLGPTPLHF